MDYEYWVFTHDCVHRVELVGDWTVERLAEMFPDAIYFYAGLVMAD